MRDEKKLMTAAAEAGSSLSGANASSQENDASFLPKEWYFIRQISTENLTRIPEESKTFTLGRDHRIDLDTVSGQAGKEGEECIVYNTFELEEDRELGFGAGADWWLEAYLNGEKIYSTMKYGNEVGSFSADNHVFTGNGKKGKNLLAVIVRRGATSWSFCWKEKSLLSASPSMPVTVTADPGKVTDRIKLMNSVNNGPIQDSGGRSNMALWREAGIPYARNHDASFCANYGGAHTVDVHLIFPDFEKDPEDPASYDFTLTDWYLDRIREAGSQIFYRLGSKIEHEPKKYGTRVPPDFKKWAIICEHIIRHYNEGWADGFHWNILYWEIWNEPDLRVGNGSPTWQGTEEQFFELYRTAATHLKRRFPDLKIGGPAVCYVGPWTRRFLAAMTANGERVPLDFFSWHGYSSNPLKMKSHILLARRLLDEAGYTETESILNEWNYCPPGGSAGDKFQAIIGIRGAAYAASVMCAGQDSPLDMLMYYDARPSVWNGLFDFYTCRPLKTYYVLLAWSKLVNLGSQIAVDTQEKTGLFAVGATDGKKTGVLICRYFDRENPPDELPVTFKLKDGDLRGAKLYLIDETHDLAEIPYETDPDGGLWFTMKADAIAYLEK